MGLDQSVLKMSQESFALVDKWQKGDREDDFPLNDTGWENLWTGRKENHIQHYIDNEVGDVDNCGYLPMEKHHVERLVDRLSRVNEDHSLAAQLLPTQEGFFFGGTDYDEWYFEDVKAELAAFTEILDDWDDDSVYAYWAWW